MLSDTLLWTTAGILLFRFALKYWRKNFSTILPGIPHNEHPWWNFLGDIPDLMKADTPVDYFGEVAQKHGNVSQIQLGPLGHVVLVADATEIEEKLLQQSHNFEKSSTLRAAFSGTIPQGSASFPTDKKWTLHRRMMAPGMSLSHLSSKTSRIFVNLHKLFAIWSLRSELSRSSDGIFECDDDIERFAMDTIIDVLYGENVKALEHSYEYLSRMHAAGAHHHSRAVGLQVPATEPYNSIRYLLEAMGKALQSGMPRVMYLSLYLNPSWRRARDYAYRLVDERLDARQRNITEGRYEQEESFLDLLYTRHPTGRPNDISPSALRDELTGFTLGGADTTATVMCWAVRYFVQNPRVQIRLHAELTESLKMSENFSMTYEELQSSRFPYLDAVVYETLRLANVGGVSARDVIEDVIISGHRIPKGTPVFFLTGHVGISAPPVENNPDIDCHAFFPERWIDVDRNGRDVFNSRKNPLWPFGYGPRSCPGKRFAMLEVKAFILMLNLSFFLLETPGSEKPQAEMLVVLRKLSRTSVKLQKWNEVNL